MWCRHLLDMRQGSRRDAETREAQTTKLSKSYRVPSKAVHVKVGSDVLGVAFVTTKNILELRKLEDDITSLEHQPLALVRARPSTSSQTTASPPDADARDPDLTRARDLFELHATMKVAHQDGFCDYGGRERVTTEKHPSRPQKSVTSSRPAACKVTWAPSDNLPYEDLLLEGALQGALLTPTLEVMSDVDAGIEHMTYEKPEVFSRQCMWGLTVGIVTS
nr:hypothetical protein CFP56_50489 [Quercus suber]POF20080.1 hypothetical protein CFP56_52329 [Quercus suber]